MKHMSANTLITSSPKEQPTDEDLMLRAISNDPVAFETLVERYRGLVFWYSLKLLKNNEQAEDVTQAVFLQLYLSHPLPRKESTSLRRWIMQVAQNRCLDVLRQRKREQQRSILFCELEAQGGEKVSPIDEIADRSALPEAIVELHDLEQAIHVAIEALPPDCQSSLLLRYKEEFTFPEIGAKLNMPTETAKSHVKRARAVLRNVLAEQI